MGLAGERRQDPFLPEYEARRSDSPCFKRCAPRFPTPSKRWQGEAGMENGNIDFAVEYKKSVNTALALCTRPTIEVSDWRTPAHSYQVAGVR